MSPVLKRFCAWLLSACLLMMPACSMFPQLGGNSVNTAERTFYLEPQLSEPVTHSGRCGDLLVGEVTAAPGFRSSRMAYSTAALNIEYYAYSRWAAGFGRLLSEPLQQALQNSGQFEHVVASPTFANSDMRMEFSDLRVMQHFTSREAATSTMTISLQARVLQTQPLNLLQSRRFELQQQATPDPEGGARVANELASRLLAEITDFAVAACARRGSQVLE